MSDTEQVAAPEVVEKKAPKSSLETDLTKYKVRKKSFRHLRASQGSRYLECRFLIAQRI